MATLEQRAMPEGTLASVPAPASVPATLASASAPPPTPGNTGMAAAAASARGNEAAARDGIEGAGGRGGSEVAGGGSVGESSVGATEGSGDDGWSSGVEVQADQPILQFGGVMPGGLVTKRLIVRHSGQRSLRLCCFVSDPLGGYSLPAALARAAPVFALTGTASVPATTGSITSTVTPAAEVPSAGTDRTVITIAPGAEVALSVAFRPSTLLYYRTCLRMAAAATPGAPEYKVPLLGYGGLSRLQLSEGPVLDLCPLLAAAAATAAATTSADAAADAMVLKRARHGAAVTVEHTISVANAGVRAGFVLGVVPPALAGVLALWPAGGVVVAPGASFTFRLVATWPPRGRTARAALAALERAAGRAAGPTLEWYVGDEIARCRRRAAKRHYEQDEDPFDRPFLNEAPLTLPPLTAAATPGAPPLLQHAPHLLYVDPLTPSTALFVPSAAAVAVDSASALALGPRIDFAHEDISLDDYFDMAWFAGSLTCISLVVRLPVLPPVPPPPPPPQSLPAPVLQCASASDAPTAPQTVPPSAQGLRTTRAHQPPTRDASSPSGGSASARSSQSRTRRSRNHGRSRGKPNRDSASAAAGTCTRPGLHNSPLVSSSPLPPPPPPLVRRSPPSSHVDLADTGSAALAYRAAAAPSSVTMPGGTRPAALSEWQVPASTATAAALPQESASSCTVNPAVPQQGHSACSPDYEGFLRSPTATPLATPPVRTPGVVARRRVLSPCGVRGGHGTPAGAALPPPKLAAAATHGHGRRGPAGVAPARRPAHRPPSPQRAEATVLPAPTRAISPVAHPRLLARHAAAAVNARSHSRPAAEGHREATVASRARSLSRPRKLSAADTGRRRSGSSASRGISPGAARARQAALALVDAAAAAALRRSRARRVGRKGAKGTHSRRHRIPTRGVEVIPAPTSSVEAAPAGALLSTSTSSVGPATLAPDAAVRAALSHGAPAEQLTAMTTGDSACSVLGGSSSLGAPAPSLAPAPLAFIPTTPAPTPRLVPLPPPPPPPLSPPPPDAQLPEAAALRCLHGQCPLCSSHSSPPLRAPPSPRLGQRAAGPPVCTEPPTASATAPVEALLMRPPSPPPPPPPLAGATEHARRGTEVGAQPDGGTPLAPALAPLPSSVYEVKPHPLLRLAFNRAGPPHSSTFTATLPAALGDSEAHVTEELGNESRSGAGTPPPSPGTPEAPAPSDLAADTSPAPPMASGAGSNELDEVADVDQLDSDTPCVSAPAQPPAPFQPPTMLHPPPPSPPAPPARASSRALAAPPKRPPPPPPPPPPPQSQPQQPQAPPPPLPPPPPTRPPPSSAIPSGVHHPPTAVPSGLLQSEPAPAAPSPLPSPPPARTRRNSLPLPPPPPQLLASPPAATPPSMVPSTPATPALSTEPSPTYVVALTEVLPMPFRASPPKPSPPTLPSAPTIAPHLTTDSAEVQSPLPTSLPAPSLRGPALPLPVGLVRHASPIPPLLSPRASLAGVTPAATSVPALISTPPVGVQPPADTHAEPPLGWSFPPALVPGAAQAPLPAGGSSRPPARRNAIYTGVPGGLFTFAPTALGAERMQRLDVCNGFARDVTVRVDVICGAPPPISGDDAGAFASAPMEKTPFIVRHRTVPIRARSYVRLPVLFRPATTGPYSAELALSLEDAPDRCHVVLEGEGVRGLLVSRPGEPLCLRVSRSDNATTQPALRCPLRNVADHPVAWVASCQHSTLVTVEPPAGSIDADTTTQILVRPVLEVGKLLTELGGSVMTNLTVVYRADDGSPASIVLPIKITT